MEAQEAPILEGAIGEDELATEELPSRGADLVCSDRIVTDSFLRTSRPLYCELLDGASDLLVDDSDLLEGACDVVVLSSRRADELTSRRDELGGALLCEPLTRLCTSLILSTTCLIGCWFIFFNFAPPPNWLVTMIRIDAFGRFATRSNRRMGLATLDGSTLSDSSQILCNSGMNSSKRFV